MRSVISLITVVALLLHVWLGCCGHHLHAGEDSRCASDQHTCHAYGDHETHCHDEGNHSEEGPADECPGKSCDESDCAFAMFGKTSLSKAWFAFGAWIAALPRWDVEPLQQFSATARIPTFAFSVPVRVHLLHQVLLI